MSLVLKSFATALMPSAQVFFAGQGGTGPYTYAVVAGGAGGAINASTGLYTAPASLSSDPTKASDTVRVTDSLAATATKNVLVTDALGLVCEILQTEMGLADGRVYLWDQKIFQPKDDGIYIAVAVPSEKPFSNVNKPDTSGSGVVSVQTINTMATFDINIISRSIAAYRRKEEVLFALNSTYAEQQQERNGFYIAKLPPGSRFINLSEVDGAAIPYRYLISINVQYSVIKSKAVDYFDTFQTVGVTTES